MTDENTDINIINAGKGLGEIEIFTDMLDAAKMKAILQAHLLPAAHRLFPQGAWWFQQDNDPKHTSDVIKRWLFDNGEQCMDFPSYSPDLNPIENLWSDLKRRVEKRNARDVEELEVQVREEWTATNLIFLSRLSHSMIHRCKAVVANHGHKTTY